MDLTAREVRKLFMKLGAEFQQCTVRYDNWDILELCQETAPSNLGTQFEFVNHVFVLHPISPFT